ADEDVAHELDTNVRARRDQAWKTIRQVLEPVPLLGLAEAAQEHDIELPDGEIPKVPRWETWYGMDDLKRMFQHLYGELASAQRLVRAPFGPSHLEDIETWNAAALERSRLWPLERYLREIERLG